MTVNSVGLLPIIVTSMRIVSYPGQLVQYWSLGIWHREFWSAPSTARPIGASLVELGRARGQLEEGGGRRRAMRST